MKQSTQNFLKGKQKNVFNQDCFKMNKYTYAKDLIDEMIIATLPILIGGGIPLFGDLNSDLSFKLLGSKTFSNGVVQNHYQRSRE